MDTRGRARQGDTDGRAGVSLQWPFCGSHMRGRGEGRREEGRIRCDSDWNGLGAGREEIRNIYTYLGKYEG
jgi:hypothetical protein